MKSSDTPKKEGPTKTWNEDSLNNALDALRTGTISANKASKAFGIPSSTLYKIARREGIRLAAPFNAAPTTWSAEDLEKALEGENGFCMCAFTKTETIFSIYSYSSRRSFGPKGEHRIWNSNG